MESTSKYSEIISNQKSCLNSNQPLVNYEQVKVNSPKRNIDHDVPKIHRKDPHIKNQVAFTEEATLKPSKKCPVKQSPEEGLKFKEKADLKADTAAIRSTSTVPYDEREVSPIFNEDFIEHAFNSRIRPSDTHKYHQK